MSRKKAVIVAASPHKRYSVKDTRRKDVGNAETHKEHLIQHGRSFWGVVKPKRRNKSWKYPDIRPGQFYIPRDEFAKHQMCIKYLKTLKE